ncbi:MAG: S41 family peptidase [Sphingomonadales bacterium]|nr:S41 family peptidase [Sphingomonadales bacterium]
MATKRAKTGGATARAGKAKSKPKPKSRAKPKPKPKPKPRRAAAASLKFLKSSHTAVREHFKAATDLPSFLATAGDLSLAGRKRLVDQALVLIDDNFVHLPLKEAMHGVDPVQKLRLIRHRLNEATPQTMESEFQFHRDMIEVFTSVRDLHTNYMLPAPFADKVAVLPFSVEEYFDAAKAPRYIATHFVQGFSHPHFKRGVEITTWNGVPIRRAVEVSADLHAGSNPAARHARGVEGLTMRALRRAMPPDAVWVVIGYIDANGVERELRQDWIVTPNLPDTGGVDPDSATANAACLGLDIEADIKQRARKMLFAPEVVSEEKKPRKISARKAAAGQSVATSMSGFFSARSVTTPSGEFGYIRIFTFYIHDPAAFIDEFVRLIGLLPQTGLIVDVRGNGGGHIYASEGLLQVLTPGEITPEPTQFINTPLNGRICKRHANNPVGIDLGPWMASIRESVETGAIYSRGFPITPHDFANSRGQRYHGPVVLITDARCYSATDIFAAGFKDHGIGHILGVDGNTGAGGANVWTHDLLRQLLALPSPADPETPYKTLPNRAGMRVAIRRTLRVGPQSGTPLEDLGVRPDSRHALTRDDLLAGNKDLITAAARQLKRMPVRGLEVTASRVGSVLTVRATTSNIARLDAYVNGRPRESLDVSDGTHAFDVDVPASAAVLRLEGYKDGALVAARRLDV